MKIRFFISDIDGTVVNRMPLYMRVFVKLLKPFKISTEEATRYFTQHIGLPLPKQLKDVLTCNNTVLSDDGIEKLVGKFFELTAREPAPLFPGVVDTLYKLKASGIHLCATSGSRSADLDTILNKHKLPFDIFQGCDPTPKGDEHIHAFAAFYGVATEEFTRSALYIGDGPGDMELAKRNHIFAVGILNTVSAELLLQAGADEIITSFPEVLKFL